MKFTSPEECLAWFQEHAPTMSKFLAVDRHWVWYCGPEMPGLEEALAPRGFRRHGSSGHPIPGTGLVGLWGNNCGRPVPLNRGPRNNDSERSVGTQRFNPLELQSSQPGSNDLDDLLAEASQLLANL